MSIVIFRFFFRIEVDIASHLLSFYLILAGVSLHLLITALNSEDLCRVFYLEHISFSFCDRVPSFVFICFSWIFNILEFFHFMMGLNTSMVVILCLICTVLLVLFNYVSNCGPFLIDKEHISG